MMKKRYIEKFMLTSILVISISLTGCSKIMQRGNNQSNVNQDNVDFSSMGKGEDSTPKPQVIEDDGVLKIGDTVNLYEPTMKDPDKIGGEYRVNTAKIYTSPREAGIETKNMSNGTMLNQSTGDSGEQEIGKTPLLVCNMDIKNIDTKEMHVSSISTLVSINPETKQIEWAWEPVYFSKSQSLDPEDSKYFHIKLAKGEEMQTEVAWLVDTEEVKFENLYLATNLGGEKPQYVYLNLH